MTVTELRPETSGYDRVPPHDADAERCVLGGMMMSQDAISDVIEVMQPSAHYHGHHQAIHEAILDLYGRGEPVDAITVGRELERRGALMKVGGAPYLHTCVAAVPSAANSGWYAQIVAGHAIMRDCAAAGTRIVQDSFSGADPADVLNRAQAAVNAIGEQDRDKGCRWLSELVPETLKRMEAAAVRGGELTGIPTGFADLDALTNGLHPGQMVIIAGRPGHGKSTLALDFARSAALRHHLATAFFSLEMSNDDVTMRVLSAEGMVPLHVIRNGQANEQDWARIAVRHSEVMNAPLGIDDSPSATLMDIRAKCRRLKQRRDLKLVIIDYLQLMSSAKRAENRQQEVSEISRSLKLLAKELDVPIVALSQLNRGPEQRQDKKPVLSDLRESGSLEQDADVVILLHRDDAYEKESPRSGEADLIVAKHRNGPTATVTVAFQGHYSRFADMAPDSWTPSGSK
jgi:replicative DNA helicase